MNNELQIIFPIAKQFFTDYFSNLSAPKILSCVAEDIFWINSYSNKTASGKPQLQKLLEAEFAMQACPYNFTIGETQLKMLCDNCFELLVCINLQTIIDIPDMLNKKDIYISLTMISREDTYLISSIHFSLPHEKQDSDTLPTSLSDQLKFKLKSNLQMQTLSLLNDSIPGGMLGYYLEVGFPLYFINDEMLKHLEYNNYDEFIQATGGFFLNAIHLDDRSRVETSILSKMLYSKEFEAKYRMIKKDNTFLWVLKRGKRIITEDGRLALISVCLDITNQVILQRKLERLAYIDDITGGHSKSRFEQMAGELIKAQKHNYALIYTNVDKFKLINERFGRVNADKFLWFLHKVIFDQLQDGELTGRLAADNFGILLKYTDKKTIISRLDDINNKIKSAIQNINSSYIINVNYGIYCPEDTNEDIVTMLDRANIARKHNISMGGSCCAFYNTKIKEHMLREKTLEDRMELALQNNEFEIYLQPKVDLRTKKIAGAEALSRWNAPCGMIYPGEFIPLFEKNGFITQLDKYVFKQICITIRRWLDQGLEPIPISTNLSKANIETRGFLDEYKTIIEEYKIPPKFIEFEFTETLAFDNIDNLVEVIAEIHAMGCSCSMDDFGSGYSSLNILKSMMIDSIKLDRVFFNLPNSQTVRGYNVIKGVIALAKSLNLYTIAEGVEDLAQVEFLRSINCDMVQGYVFSRPVPISEFERLKYQEAQG